LSQGAVVLAAGAGSRFLGETHKLLSSFRGRPLVLWAVEAALEAVGAGIDGVAVVTGATELAGVLPPGVTLLINEDWESGQASSLRSGLDWCLAEGYEAAVVGLADQPLVPPSAWRAVAAARQAPIAAASYGGRRRNPVRLDRSVWALLPSEGDEGARVVMRQHPEMVAEVACDGNPADVDTLEDLAQWS
jgi:nicotine blue oxidoreductase